MLGMWLESHLAREYVNVDIVSPTMGTAIAQQARQAGSEAMQFLAQGKSGPVQLVEIVVTRKQLAQLLQLTGESGGAASVAVKETWQVIHPN